MSIIDKIKLNGTTYDVGKIPDTTLTQSGQAADAKAVGDKFDYIEGSLYDDKDVSFVVGSTITTNVSAGSEVDLTPVANGSYAYTIVECVKSQKFTITAKGGDNARVWAFTDENNNLISKADSFITVTNLELTAPADGKLIVNAYIYNTYSLSEKIYKDEGLRDEVDSIKHQLFSTVNANDDVIKGSYIDLSGNIGSVIDTDSPVSNSGYGYAVFPCSVGDKITITCKGGNASRAWAVLDSDKKLLAVAPSYATVSALVLTCGEAGYFVVNVNLAFDYNILRSYIAVSDLISDLETDVSDLEGKTNITDLVLPRTVYGVIGHEFNLYKDNALIYGDIDSVADVKFIPFLNGYLETKKRYSGTPNAAYDAYPQLSLYRTNIKARDTFKNLHLIVKDSTILNGLTRNIVIIGDSKVAGGRLPQVFKNLCADAGMIVGDLYGSIYSANMGVNHEGRAGWSSSDYFLESKSGVTNAFYNGGTFDFAYWMNQQGYTHIDYVFINLGTNDYGRVDGLGSDTYIQTFIDNINAMIASIHAYDNTIKIVIGLSEGVCTSQRSSDSDEELRSLTTRARLLNKASIAQWDTTSMQNQNVWTCPIYLSMDMENDYVMSEEALSEWDAYFNTGKTRNRVSDKMHQNAVGYAKNATYMFALMTYIESLNA